jgi:Domain of unknown function (DUF5134)
VQSSSVVGWLLAAITATAGLYCLARIPATHGRARRAACSEAVMGLGMAVMSTPVGGSAQGTWGAALFACVFGLLTVSALRSVWRERRSAHRAHHAHHAVGAASMVYMAVVAALAPRGVPMAGMAAHGGMGIPVLTGALLVYFAVFALGQGPRLVLAGGGPAGAAGAAGRTRDALADPALAAACRVAMGIGMFAMLLTM